VNYILLVLNILTFFGLGAAVLLVRKGLSGYLTEKGKNLATKEDIEVITRQVESVKIEFSTQNAIEEQKRKLKYEACLEALSVIDGFFAQIFNINNPRPTPQPVSTINLRETHNKLILSCDNIKIVEKFCEINFGPRPGEDKCPPTDLLNEFRNLVRAELGFGNQLPLDRERAWAGQALGDPNNPPKN